jgi:hypothetical protein
MRTGLALVLAALGSSSPLLLAAQQTLSLQPGQLLRVTAPSALLDRTVGTVLAARGHEIVFRVERFRPYHERLDTQMDTLYVTVALDSIRSLWVSSGTSSHVAGFAILGVVVGGAAGALLYSPSPSPPPPRCAGNPFCGMDLGFRRLDVTVNRVLWAGIGSLAGAVIGASIGSQVRTTRWKLVEGDALDRLRVGLAPLPAGRLGLGASISF